MKKLLLVLISVVTLIGCKKNKDKDVDTYDSYDYKTQVYDVIIIDTTVKKGDYQLTLNTTYIDPWINPHFNKSRWEHISGSVYKVKIPGKPMVYYFDDNGPMKLMDGSMYCRISFNTGHSPTGDTIYNFSTKNLLHW